MSSTDSANIIILFIACPPSIAFVVTYGFLQPWYKSWWGWALFSSAASLSMLLVVNLLFRLYGWELLAREGWLRTCVYGLITLGTWLTFIALLVVLRKARRKR